MDSFIAFFGCIEVNNTLENTESYRAICCQQKEINQKSHSQFLTFCGYRLHSKWTVVGYAVYTHPSQRRQKKNGANSERVEQISFPPKYLNTTLFALIPPLHCLSL